MPLTQKHCVPCQGGIPPLTPKQISPLLSQLKSKWKLADHKQISLQFKFKDFVSAIKFINQVADIAEAEDHHPDIHLTGWNKVKIVLSTHKINGLHQNDFILAAKIEQLVS